jgi:hypothetical protein
VFNEDEIIEYSLTGTGFFISSTGMIATNKHVTSPSVCADSEFDAYLALKEHFTANNSEIYINIVNSHVEQIDLLDQQLSDVNMSQEDYNNTMIEREKWYNDYLFWTNLEKNNFNFNANNAVLQIHSTKLGVAFNNTFTTDVADFKDCIDISNELNFPQDLAIIQLKDKKTPQNVKDFANLSHKISIGGRESLKINSKVYMIGFNSGQEVGNTSNGLANQLTQGTVSQMPDKSQVLYSIPTLSGSSGSPIFGENGELLAVNYAGISNTQNFNYGILAKHLLNLFKKVNN